MIQFEILSNCIAQEVKTLFRNVYCLFVWIFFFYMFVIFLTAAK